MAVEPKVLNKINTGYGKNHYDNPEWRCLVGQALGPFWSGDFRQRGIKNLFDAGKFREAITAAHKFLARISSVQALEDMNEAELAVFFYLGLSYAQIGETEKAISCLHIVLSQNRFVSSLLVGFSQFIDMADRKLKELAEEHGEELVNRVDPVLFLQHHREALS